MTTTAQGGSGAAPSGRSSRRRGRLLVNTGNGKGKSSAAFGVMGRAWARGWRVAVVQFIKSPGWTVGERTLADHLGVDWHTLGDGFTWESEDLDETAAKARHAWEVAAATIASGEYDLVILDEVTYAVTLGWVPVEDVVATLRDRPDRTSVIVTGRDAPEEIVALADTVTEMVAVKHAHDQGIPARKGIEY